MGSDGSPRGEVPFTLGAQRSFSGGGGMPRAVWTNRYEFTRRRRENIPSREITDAGRHKVIGWWVGGQG